jgi:hypothetical protein
MMFVAGAFTYAFGIAWSMGIYHDPSNFLLSMALGITMMALAQVGRVVLKQGEDIEELNKRVKQNKEETFEFEGWVRDKLK